MDEKNKPKSIKESLIGSIGGGAKKEVDFELMWIPEAQMIFKVNV
jgi:hypothetical protein